MGLWLNCPYSESMISKSPFWNSDLHFVWGIGACAYTHFNMVISNLVSVCSILHFDSGISISKLGLRCTCLSISKWWSLFWYWHHELRILIWVSPFQYGYYDKLVYPFWNGDYHFIIGISNTPFQFGHFHFNMGSYHSEMGQSPFWKIMTFLITYFYL